MPRAIQNPETQDARRLLPLRFGPSGLNSSLRLNSFIDAKARFVAEVEKNTASICL